MANGADEILRERADAASSIVEELKSNSVPEEIAHDLLIGYTQAIEGYYMEEWGARKVMIAAGALAGTLNRYMEAKKQEILKKGYRNHSSSGSNEQQEE